MLYPRYDRVGTSAAASMTAAPLVKVKFGNLISDALSGGGLVGTLDGAEYMFDVEGGATFGAADGITNDEAQVQLYPQIIKVSCTFHPLHQHDLGNYLGTADEDSFGNQGIAFPYFGKQPQPTNTPTNVNPNGKMDEQKQAEKDKALGKT